jgi:hypothetical protein
MEILRVPPYPLTTTWNLPDANYAYIVYVEDLVDHSVEEITISSDENGTLVYELPLSSIEFDRDFLIRFYDAEHEHIIYEENLTIIRPYVNPADLGTTPSEIKEFKMYELIARSIIDTYTNNGFYNHKSVVISQGNGLDYMPIWRDANRVLKVYENNVLIYDLSAEDPATNMYNFSVALDNSAIQKTSNEYYNRLSATDPRMTLPISRSDAMFEYTRDGGVFHKSYDYMFILDEGFRAVPSDVTSATTMLINDLKCGNLDYYKQYVKSYDTDQFKISFDEKRIASGTGNFIVDRMLEKYTKSILKIGVL